MLFVISDSDDLKFSFNILPALPLSLFIILMRSHPLSQHRHNHGCGGCHAHVHPSILLRVPLGLLWSSLGKDMADIDVATGSGIQDGTEQIALEHGQTVTSRALVVESSVTTRTLIDIILV